MSRPVYELTLTKSERDAIDWVGDRYSHGDGLYDLLTDTEMDGLELYDMSLCEAWGELSCDLTFQLTEGQAWVVHDIMEDDPEFTCFSDELTFKLLTFCHNLV